MKTSKTISCPAYLFFEQDEKGNKKQDGVMGINPVYMTKGSACADVAIPYDIVIPAHKAAKFDLWIGFEIPEGYKVIMYPRSSLLVKYSLLQPVSIIDSDYSGQHVHVPFFNPTDTDIKLEKGTRVAQIECVPAYNCEDWEHKNKDRGEGGFGSTGK